MSWTYRCPKCKATLSPDSSIILCAKQGTRRILIGFHPEPGNYESYLPPDAEIQDGDAWDFFCPVCNASLACEDNENLCMLDALVEGRESNVLFSRIAGEKVTFVVSDRKVQQQHGKDVDHYIHHLMKMNTIL